MLKIKSKVSAALFSVVLGICTLFSQAQAASFWEAVQQKGELKVGAAAAAPYTIRDARTGEWSGVYIDLLREFSEEIGVELVVVDTTWDNIVAGLQAGKWDIAPALNQTVKRALVINYTEAPSYGEVNFLFNKNNPKIQSDWKSVADFDKKDVRIAVISGSAQDQAVSALIKNATVQRFPGLDEARLAVMSKRADLIVDEWMQNDLFNKKNADWSAVVFPEPAISKQGIAYGVRSDVTAADMDALNFYIEQQRSTGRVDRMFQNYIKVMSEK